MAALMRFADRGGGSAASDDDDDERLNIFDDEDEPNAFMRLSKKRAADEAPGARLMLVGRTISRMIFCAQRSFVARRQRRNAPTAAAASRLKPLETTRPIRQQKSPHSGRSTATLMPNLQVRLRSPTTSHNARLG